MPSALCHRQAFRRATSYQSEQWAGEAVAAGAGVRLPQAVQGATALVRVPTKQGNKLIE